MVLILEHAGRPTGNVLGAGHILPVILEEISRLANWPELSVVHVETRKDPFFNGRTGPTGKPANQFDVSGQK
jgi:hypothetical protein